MIQANSLLQQYLFMATDKGTWHSYIDHYYDAKFTPLKNEPINMVEIGVWWGASLRLWSNWFKKGFIYGIDPEPFVIDNIRDIPRVIGVCADAYLESTLALFTDGIFDIVIEDGPHTLETQCRAAMLWTKKLKPGGVLIIEDVSDPDKNAPIIESCVDKNLYNVVHYDFRKYKNRADDYLLEITKK